MKAVETHQKALIGPAMERLWHTGIQSVALAIGAGVLAGACGGDGGSAPSSPPPTTPAPTPTPPPPPPPPPTCAIGLVLRAGDSCTYPGTSQTFTVNADGSATFAFITSSTSINISSNNLTLVANRQSDGSWIIERVGAESRNRAPVAVGSISNQTLTEGEDPRTVDVSTNFVDADGDALTYAATSSRTSAVRVNVSGSLVTLTPVSAGTATITVTATDSPGLSATQRFEVSVSARPTGGAVTFGVGERIPTFPQGSDATRGFTSRGGVSVSVQGGRVTIRMVRGAYLQYDDYRYTCDASQCEIEDGVVAAGVIERTAVDEGGGGITGEGTRCGDSRATPSSSSEALVRDCGILLEARDELRGTGRLNWSVDLEIGSWDGVHSTRDGVTGVSLVGWGLTGSIPGSFGSLTSLQTLYLYRNELTGPIPDSLGNLTNLKWLILQSNDLTGAIPDALGNLTNLEVLDLWQNRLTGVIPDSLGNLTNLKVLHLGLNDLTGAIPGSLRNLANLENVGLYQNGLSGAIPDWLGNLTNLEMLLLWQNNLTGTVPDSLGNLTHLRILWLDRNNLSGAIPDSLGSLTNLEELRLHSNRLTGCIPMDLADFLSSINPQQGGVSLEVCGEDPGAGTDTFRVGDRIPDFPTGPPQHEQQSRFRDLRRRDRHHHPARRLRAVRRCPLHLQRRAVPDRERVGNRRGH